MSCPPYGNAFYVVQLLFNMYCTIYTYRHTGKVVSYRLYVPSIVWCVYFYQLLVPKQYCTPNPKIQQINICPVHHNAFRGRWNNILFKLYSLLVDNYQYIVNSITELIQSVSLVNQHCLMYDSNRSPKTIKVPDSPVSNDYQLQENLNWDNFQVLQTFKTSYESKPKK